MRYPIGFPRWSYKPEKEYNSDLLGFYEIEYIPPTNIRVPRLPHTKILRED